MRTERHDLLDQLAQEYQLTNEQRDQLAHFANEIDERYPDAEGQDPDNTDEYEAALTAAARLMTEDEEDVAAELADDLLRARQAQAQAMAAIQQAATMLIDPQASKTSRGLITQSGFASFMGVDRMTVRRWLRRT